MKRIAVFLIFAASLHAQITGTFTGAVGTLPASIPQAGLTHAWFPQGIPAKVVDSIGTQNLTAVSGILQGIADPGWNFYGDDLIIPASGQYYSTPGTQYNLSAATGTSYTLSSASFQTWGNGQPHTMICLCKVMPYTYSSGGGGATTWTPFHKNNEYGISIAQGSGGSIALKYGTSLASTVTAAAFPASGNRWPSLTGSTVNLYSGWYLLRITYDGSSSICIGINNAAATCATGVTITTSASDLNVIAPINVEMLLSYNSVLLSSNDSGATCGAAWSATPCIVDTLYNLATYNRYPWNQQANPASVTTLQVNGSVYVGDQGWGTTYNTYQSATQTTPTYILPNPHSTFAVTTNAPALTLNVVALNGTAGLNSFSANVTCTVDAGTYQILQAQYTGGQPITLALPGDGATHTVKCNAASYEQAGSTATPFVAAGSTLVNSVSVYGNYTLAGVTPSYANEAIIEGDSISVGYNTNYSETDSAFVKLRTNSGGNVGNLIFDGMGNMQLWHIVGCNPGAGGGSSTTCTATAWPAGGTSNTSSLTPAAYANLMKARYGCPKYTFWEYATNDYSQANWYAADAQTAMGYFWTQWNSICPAVTNYQLSPNYRQTETPNAKGDYLVQYTSAGVLQSPSWQADLAAACTAATSCTSLNTTGTSSSGTVGNTAGFPIYGDTTYSNCNAVLGTGPSATNNAFNTDGLHPTTCGQQMYYLALFHGTLGWF